METVGAPDGQHQLAYPQLAGIAELRDRQVAGVGPQHREVAGGVRTQNFGLGVLAVGEGDLDLLGTFYNMVVGDDQSVRGDHHAGSVAGGGVFPRRPAAPLDRDVDHGGPQPVGDRDDRLAVGVEDASGAGVRVCRRSLLSGVA